MEQNAVERMSVAILDKLKMALIKQKIAWMNLYTVRSGSIAVTATNNVNINIAADSDFICERMFAVIETEFTNAGETILMNFVDQGSARQITRNPVDMRCIANPGMFAPGSANEGNAHYVRGIEWKYLFRKNSTLQYEFNNTEVGGGNVHFVSVVLQGFAVSNWKDIPNDIVDLD